MKPTKKACEMTVKELASYIDQSVLKPEFTREEIRKYIQEGIDYGCRTVCINPSSLDIAAELCKSAPAQLSAWSATSRSACPPPLLNVCRPRNIVSAATFFELDIVANYGWIRSGMWDAVGGDPRCLRNLPQVRHRGKGHYGNRRAEKEEIIKATKVLVAAGADFVKSSTGFYTGGPSVGATEEIVALMLEAADGKAKVKGSGCIRTRAFSQADRYGRGPHGHWIPFHAGGAGLRK